MRRGGGVPEKWTWPNGLLSALHISGGPGGTWNLGLPELRGLAPTGQVEARKGLRSAWRVTYSLASPLHCATFNLCCPK